MLEDPFTDSQTPATAFSRTEAGVTARGCQLFHRILEVAFQGSPTRRSLMTPASRKQRDGDEDDLSGCAYSARPSMSLATIPTTPLRQTIASDIAQLDEANDPVSPFSDLIKLSPRSTSGTPIATPIVTPKAAVPMIDTSTPDWNAKSPARTPVVVQVDPVLEAQRKLLTLSELDAYRRDNAPWNVSSPHGSYDGNEIGTIGCRVVVMEGLPDQIRKRDVISRVRGGPVDSVKLVDLRPINGDTSAIITFAHAQDAARYVYECSSSYKLVFRANNGDLHKIQVRLATHNHEGILMVKTPYTQTYPLGKEKKQLLGEGAISRCVIIKKFPRELLFALWSRVLGLDWQPARLSQLDDVWYDSEGDLHLSFGDLDIACGCLERINYAANQVALLRNHKAEYETDPCTGPFCLLEDEESVRISSFPHVSLLELNSRGVLDRLFRGEVNVDYALTPDDDGISLAITDPDHPDASRAWVPPPPPEPAPVVSISSRRAFIPPRSYTTLANPSTVTAVVTIYDSNAEDTEAVEDDVRAPLTSADFRGRPYDPRGHYYLEVSLEEFLEMSDEQWSRWGTVFYVPPPGFNTSRRVFYNRKRADT